MDERIKSIIYGQSPQQFSSMHEKYLPRKKDNRPPLILNFNVICGFNQIQLLFMISQKAQIKRGRPKRKNSD